ncbi:hypothetical protein BT96DRAFT_891999 [Gymnopus androsaceus JB14]|uniref:LysM domain-containing protein n=1 Tax=Gymnopus androsaceus JB14 TaxID=1447944 RepID=A0A6A4GJ52_9AGAR|nr:hypothetical protein BT96DRAFT_891999 [Gymnopus androsaceus JB14]
MYFVLGAHVLTQSSCQANYTVVSGDACVPIAAKFNAGFLLKYLSQNAVNANCDNLFVGQKLCIPFPPQGCSAQHTIISGDNCQTIAAEFGTTYAALLTANPTVDANCDNLTVGKVLCIPAATCSAQYTIKSGDVCISIANQFGITTAELEAANSEIDPLCNNLQVDEVNITLSWLNCCC